MHGFFGGRDIVPFVSTLAMGDGSELTACSQGVGSLAGMGGGRFEHHGGSEATVVSSVRPVKFHLGLTEDTTGESV